MPLSAGAKLGPYEIVAPIGAGGMGEVYRARDPRLGREVALKILPADVVNDPSHRQRFELEARAVAALNHPNIVAVYDVGEGYIVSELVDGQPLRGGDLSLRKTVEIAVQIAGALAAAHDAGIVHRDLKPDNILLTRDGRPKILDFGLAKMQATRPAAADETVTVRTEAGVVMGTPGYMSPEQVRGLAADHRSDIFSFGVILYELLAGKRAFHGETSVETMTAILKQDTPELPGEVPPALRQIVAHCLEKDPEERFQSARDLRFALSQAGIPSGSQCAIAAPAQSRFPGASWVISGWVIAGVALVTLAVLAFIHFRETPPAAKLITAAILPPNNAPADAAYRWPKISPDGSRIVFAQRVGIKSQLWLCPLDSSTPQPLPGTEGGWDPFWSPDGRSIAFFADQKLKRIDLPDGAPVILADAPLGDGGGWSATGVIVFAPAAFRGLERVPAAGGASTPMALGQGTHYPTPPSFLPDGRHFLFMDLADSASRHGVLKIGSLDSSEVKTLWPADSNAVYGSGRILFLRGSTLIAQGFDERRLAASQDASPVARNVLEFSVSRDGTVVYQGGNADVLQLTWFDRKGAAAGTLGDPANFYTIEFSPDRKKVALSLDEDLWIHDVARDLRSRFTFTPGIDTNPVWSTDGLSVAFCSNRTGRYGIYRKSVDLSGAEETLYLDATDTLTDSWSADGKFVMVHRRDPANQEDLALLPLTPDAPGGALKLTPFLNSPFRELHGRFSPDGRWVAYISNESGHSEIYVTSFPGYAGKQQISTAGGSQPRWRADGKELFFVSGAGVLMAAEVAIQGSAVAVGAVRSFGIPVVMGRGWGYDVSADGQRFLVAVRQKQKAPPLTLVSNWPLLLKK